MTAEINELNEQFNETLNIIEECEDPDTGARQNTLAITIIDNDDPLESMRKQILELYRRLEEKNENGNATETEQNFLEVNKKTKDGKFLKIKLSTRGKEYYRDYRALKKQKLKAESASGGSVSPAVSYSKYTIGPHAPGNAELARSIKKYEKENTKIIINKNAKGEPDEKRIPPKDSDICRHFNISLYGLNKLRYSAAVLESPSQQS